MTAFKRAKSKASAFFGSAEVAMVKILLAPICLLNSSMRAAKFSLSNGVGVISGPHAVSPTTHGYSKSISKPSKAVGY